MKEPRKRKEISKSADPIKSVGDASSRNSTRKPIVLVAGDAAIDWFLYPVSADAGPTNWRQLPAMHSMAAPGGVCLLTHFLKQIVEVEGGHSSVVGPELKDRQLREFSPDKVIHSNAILEDPDSSDDEKRNQRLRIGQSLGFMGPAQGSPQFRFPTASTPSADVIVLDDVGNGFRTDQRVWPSALKGTNQPWVIHKMSSPLATGNLWEKLSKSPSDKRLVVVTADALRQITEVQISSGLSWERTARDFVFQIQRSPLLRTLQQCPYLVVLFGVEGAILYRGGELDTPSTLIFDPVHLEGQYQDSIPGTVFGMTALITAAIASSLAAKGIENLEDGIKSGLHFARCFLERGYPCDPSALFLPNADEWKQCPMADDDTFATCLIERPNSYQQPDPEFWRILDAKTRNSRLIAAEEVVIRGKAMGLSGVPIGKFGKLQTIDRAEIESYNAIRRLIGEFLAEPNPERPLSFAVFGPPGSGKSFGVKQVMASLGRKDLESVTFNISQFRSYGELVSSLHRVRDIVLSGKIPFVFFDEFDAGFEERTLGWLKYFLAPMQDGEFKDGESVYHIGRAVFVFAGGTRSCFDDFVKNRPSSSEDKVDDDPSSAGPPNYDPAVYGETAFRQAKGPDFASRLRGFIDIMGPNRQHPKDDAFIIRRANVLRSMLEKLRTKADRLFEPGGKKLRIDPGVLRAMLNIGEYRHGIRSMEAIIGMSRLAGRSCFDLSALPPKDQLDLHVDSDEFLYLAERERFVNLIPPRDFPAIPSTTPADCLEKSANTAMLRESALVELIAKSIHEEYRRQRAILGEKGSIQSWEDLSEEKRNSNRDAASHIPTKLRLIGHGVRKIGNSGIPRTPDISDEEILILARAEHERWAGEQKLQGFRFGKKKDIPAKVSPYLVPFDDLRPEIQAYDIQAVEAIPRCLAQVGLEVYRMTEVDRLSDPWLIDRLARSIHEDYVRQRTKEGDTPETNSSLVPFEDLKGDLLEANLDNARSIPRKLRAIKLGIRRTPGHRAPLPLVLNSTQVETLAEMEHSRWNWQKLLQGWICAPPPKDEEKKTTPHLVPWARLPNNIREYDRETVRLIPALLMQAGYEAYPIEG
ncbi:MAG: AAA family ATPase [Verrucomicrobiales bacterium]|nr:AAA family ATPase [Verrucomicrobiales bacterium]